jgi:hypothetical protein
MKPERGAAYTTGDLTVWTTTMVDGTKKLHRDYGPAVEHNGYKAWYQFGKLHREDGPAQEYEDGNKIWWLHNKQVICDTQEEFERLMRLKAFW